MGPSDQGRAAAWAANLGLLVSSVLVCLAVLEVGARLLLTLRHPISRGEQAVSSMHDPVLGWRNRPHASVRYQRREFVTEVSFNSLGFRDVERSTSPLTGYGRALAIGDSFIEGYTVNLEESLTRRAEALSRSRGCRVEMVNAGVHGYSTDQEALWFEREARALQPEVVVLFVYYNDVLNNVRGNYWGSPKPLTRVVGDEVVPINLPLPERHDAEPRLEFSPPRIIEGSALLATLKGRLLLGAPDGYNLLARAGLWEPVEPEPIPDELRAYKLRGQLSEFDEAWERTGDLLGAMARTIRSRHARPVLAYVPARFEVSERDWRLTVIRYGLDPGVWDRSLVKGRFEQLARQEQWEFLDLTPPLKAAGGLLRGEPYFQFDGHWNALGHDTAAQATVDFLARRSLLPCGGVEVEASTR